MHSIVVADEKQSDWEEVADDFRMVDRELINCQGIKGKKVMC
jgi:hypothetical protein